MAYTVTQLNNIIKDYIDDNASLKRVQVIGEISNLKKHHTGHWYLTLKDENSRINAIVFASYASRIKIKIEDGMKVVVTGSISAYVQGGSYQIYINAIDPIGVGALYMQYEVLKKKLAEEGLFSSSLKKDIPKYPNKIGVISAPQGAAVRDVITTIRRRWPVADIILLSSLVQGAQAAPDVLEKLIQADNMGFDTIIVARGGGSIEDLWCFNDEQVARQVFLMKTPIISAIGHETDTTIIDYVSDARAATPTAAAELATPNIQEVLISLKGTSIRMSNKLLSRIEFFKESIKKTKLRSWYINPEMLYISKHLKCENYLKRINDASNKNFTYLHKKINSTRINLKNSLLNINMQKKNKYINLLTTLDALSPLKVLERGYSVVRNEKGTVNSIKQIKESDLIKIKLKDGQINASVISKEEK